MTEGECLHRHRRSKLIIANFTGFEADLLRFARRPAGRAAPQRGGGAARRRRPVEAMLDLRPDPGAEDPVLARLFLTAAPGGTRRRRPSSGGFTEGTLRDGRRPPAIA